VRRDKVINLIVLEDSYWAVIRVVDRYARW